MTTQERSSEHPPGFAQSPAAGMSVAGTEPGGPGTWTHPRTGEVYQNDYRIDERPASPWRCPYCDSEVMTYNAPLDARGTATEKRIRLLHDEACPTIIDSGDRHG